MASYRPGIITVRARLREHLVNLVHRFAGTDVPVLKFGKIVKTVNRDYGWWLHMPHKQWAQVAAALAFEQEWSKFKPEAARAGKERGDKFGGEYVSCLYRVWNVMYDLEGMDKKQAKCACTSRGKSRRCPVHGTFRLKPGDNVFRILPLVECAMFVTGDASVEPQPGDKCGRCGLTYAEHGMRVLSAE